MSMCEALLSALDRQYFRNSPPNVAEHVIFHKGYVRSNSSLKPVAEKLYKKLAVSHRTAVETIASDPARWEPMELPATAHSAIDQYVHNYSTTAQGCFER